MFGVYLGDFQAEICSKCNESFTDEKTTRAIEKAAKKKGIWGQEKNQNNKNRQFFGCKNTKRNRRFSKIKKWK